MKYACTNNNAKKPPGPATNMNPPTSIDWVIVVSYETQCVVEPDAVAVIIMVCTQYGMI
jgi:hypothetical protein